MIQYRVSCIYLINAAALAKLRKESSRFMQRQALLFPHQFEKEGAGAAPKGKAAEKSPAKPAKTPAAKEEAELF